jgi:hypothetical protein
MLAPLWKLLHLFFAFSFVGSLVVAEWNGRAARVSTSWSQRALLFSIIMLSTRVAGFGSLILTGVFGNLLSLPLGYSMREGSWLRWVNGLWLLAVIVMAFVVLPNVRRLAATAAKAEAGEAPDGWESALARWRFGNVVLSVTYLALLAIMVLRWRS